MTSTTLKYVVLYPVLLAASAGVCFGQPAPCGGDLDQMILENGAGVDRTFLRRVRVIDGQAWAVGWEERTGGSFTLTMRLEDGEWVRVESPSLPNVIGEIENSLSDLYGTSSSNIWAVGRYQERTNASDTLALHWDGSEWEHVLTPGQSKGNASGYIFEGVYAPDEDTAWFVGFAASCERGEGFIVRSNGDGSFDEFCVGNQTNEGASYRDVHGLGTDNIWAVGGRGGVASAIGRAIAAHWDGSSWAPNNPPVTNIGEVLQAVVVVGPDDVWATGKYDEIVNNVAVATPLFWHWDGSGWTRHESPGFAVDLLAFASDDIYGVSDDTIVHWNGQEWSLLDQRFETGGASFIGMFGLSAFGQCDLVFAGHTLSPWKASVARLEGDGGCVADFTGDGLADFFDLSAFLNAFNAGDPAADLTGDGLLDFFDLSEFLGAFAAGCP